MFAKFRGPMALRLVVCAALAGCGAKEEPERIVSSADLLEVCVGYTPHELDQGREFQHLGDVSWQAAVRSCEQAAKADPASMVALEHLSRAYLAASRYNQPAMEQKGLEAMAEAAKRGSAYATSKLAQLGLAGGDLATAQRLLQPLVEAKNPGAMILLAQTRATTPPSQIRPPGDLQREGVFELFDNAVAAGGAATLRGWVFGRMADGGCGRLAPISETKSAVSRQTDTNAELYCGAALTSAANGGDSMANMQLGLSHLQAALQYAQQPTDVAVWRARMNSEKQLARQRLAIVQRSGDTFFKPLVERLLPRIDGIEMQQDRASREFWTSVLVGGFALLAASDQAGARGENAMDRVDREQRESRERLRCEQARSYASHYSGDATEVGAAERAYAAGC